MSETEMPVVAEPRQFRAANYFVGAVLVVMAVHQVSYGSPFNVSLAILLLLSAAGLLRTVRWGRRMAVLFMWLLVVYAIGGVLPARIEVDEAQARAPLSSTQLIVELVLMSGVALGSLHLLGRHKARYRAAWW
jgi:uncharacterized membrane protein YoaK (UPF0700 family)